MATYLGHQEDSSGNILLPTPHSMATQIEFGTTASQAYAKGAYVVFNNRLCKASTAIASGDTLAIGTNLVQCSIGSELNSHLQAPNGSEFYFDYKDNKPGFYPSASKVASEFVPFGGSAQVSQVASFNSNNKSRSSGSASFTTTNNDIILTMCWTRRDSGDSDKLTAFSLSGETRLITGANAAGTQTLWYYISKVSAGSHTLSVSWGLANAWWNVVAYRIFIK